MLRQKVCIYALLLLSELQSVVKCDTDDPSVARNSFDQEIYDYDTSWAIKTRKLSDRFGDKQGLYDGFIRTCKEAAGEENAVNLCDHGEERRLEMNNFQPMSMRNYSDIGFRKIRAPEELFSLIQKFWRANKDKSEEEWHSINVYHNMWESPPSLVNVQSAALSMGGPAMRELIWSEARRVLEEWTGMHLAPCSMWGIRLYHNNSILTTHVDRNPLVTSAIINVDQDVDEPWPLEVWGHDGMPYNITMQPGDMVLYESHSILHGRPFPMNGNFYANIFLHFEPLGTYRKEADDNSPDYTYAPESIESMQHGLPPYVLPGSIWEKQWRLANPSGWKLLFEDKRTYLTGNLKSLENLYIKDPEGFHAPDENGWTPIHEAARSGNTQVVNWLLERNADPTVVTNNGLGFTALQLAEQHHGTDHEVYSVLKNHTDEIDGQMDEL